MTKRGKIVLFSVVGVVVVFVVLPLLVLFTPPGNYLLRPVVESQINAKSPVKVSVSEFRLTPSHVRLKADFGEDSYLLADGTYGMFSKAFDIDYTLRVGDFKSLSSVLPKKVVLRGGVEAKGNVKGDPDKFVLNGTADLAGGDTKYEMTIADSALDKAVVHIRGLGCGKLLSVLCKPEIMDGSVDADVELTGFKDRRLKGKIRMELSNAAFDGECIRREYDIDLPKDLSIGAKLDVALDAGAADCVVSVYSSLAKLDVKGNMDLNTRDCAFDYAVDVAELALLEPLINRRLNGPLKVGGKISGGEAKLNIDGDTDFGGGKTVFRVVLLDFKPGSAKFDTRGASLAAILHTVDKPRYADAVLDASGEMTSLAKGKLKGVVHLVLKKGKTFPDVLEKVTGRKNIDLSFEAVSDTGIVDSVATTRAKVDSSVANIRAEKAVFDIESGDLNSDYTLVAPDLDALYPFTERHLSGKLKVVGKVSAKKDGPLVVDAHSDTFGGAVDARLEGDDLTSRFKGLGLAEICRTLLYPEVFASKLDGKVSYNLKSKKGTFDVASLGGHVIPNQLTAVIERSAKFDLTKEIYKKSDIRGTIEDKVVVADLNMASKHSKITSKGASINLADDTVDADLRFDIKKKPFNVKITGPIRDPKLDFDVSELVIDELEKAIEKKVPKKHRKTIKAIRGLLDGFLEK